MGLTVCGPIDDTKVLAYLENPQQELGLKSLVEKKLNKRVIRLEDLYIKGKKKELEKTEGLIKIGSHYLDKERLISYNKEDVSNCDELKMNLVSTNWYNTVERPLSSILFNMEQRGIKIDRGYLENIKNETEKKIRKFDFEFNPRSQKQVKEVITKKYGPVESTDKLTLKRMCWGGNKLASDLLEHRKIAKLHSTYILPILEQSKKTGRLHGTFNQVGVADDTSGTVTGRLSSANPNLQNIPARTEEGKKIRRAFIPSDDMFMIVSDLKQIEPRLVAHYSQSPKLLKAYAEGLDTHALMASDIFNKCPDKLTKMERFIGKTSWLASVYGAWYKKLKVIVENNSEEEIPYNEDYYREVQEQFWRTNPEIASWRRWHIESTRHVGYITTIGNRTIKITGLNSKNQWERKEAERMCVNYLIQGSAADVMKMILVKIDEEIQQRKLGYLLATIHDEVLLEMPLTNENNGINIKECSVVLINSIMSNTVKLKNVHIEADTKIINNWGDK